MSISTSTARNPSLSNRSGANTAPVNFAPAVCPIIATHWFGFRPIGVIIVPVIRRLENLREAPNAPA